MTRARKAAKQPPARNRIDNTFLDDFLADWRENGAAAIENLRQDKPADYVRIAASVLAKEAHHEVDPLDELTDAELAERIETIAASIGLEVRPRAPAHRAGEAGDGGATE